MTDIKKLSFKDFQKMLSEVGGKPVYCEEKDKFILEWTGGGFVYQTIVKFRDIESSYAKQFPGANGDAIVLFKDRYLRDCFKELVDYARSEEIPLMNVVETVREGSIKEFVKLELNTRNGEKVVEGIRKDGSRGVLRNLGRIIKSRKA